MAAAGSGRDFDAIVAIDIGTHGTAYSISLSSGTGDLAALAKAVTAYKLGEGSGATHKEPSALLLTADAANTTLDVGSKAWDSFADMCDNPRGAPAVYFHHFMSALAPRSDRPADLSSIVIRGAPTRRAAAAAGDAAAAADADTTSLPLYLLVTRLMEAVRSDALNSLRATAPAANPSRVAWSIAVPSIWDAAVHTFIRRCAAAAGLVGDASSSLLHLVDAGKAALLAAVADKQVALAAGASALVVNCGGGSVDSLAVTLSAAAEPGPVALQATGKPSGGPWGGVVVDEAFTDFIRELVSAAKFDQLDAGTRHELALAWEEEKRKFAGADAAAASSGGPIMLTAKPLLRNLGDLDEEYDVDSLRDAIDALNRKHAAELGAGSSVSLDKQKRLTMPASLVRSLLMRSVSAIAAHVGEQVTRVPGLASVLLVGGFAASPLLQAQVRASAGATAVVVAEPAALAVVRGAAIAASLPDAAEALVGAGSVSFAYLAAEAFNAAVHDEDVAVTTADGRRIVPVLHPLLARGDGAAMHASVAPAADAAAVIDLEIYRVEGQVADVRRDAAAQRCVVVEDAAALAGAGAAGRRCKLIPRSALAVKLTVAPGGEGLLRADRAVDLALQVRDGELVASATRVASGDKLAVTTVRCA